MPFSSTAMPPIPTPAPGGLAVDVMIEPALDRLASIYSIESDRHPEPEKLRFAEARCAR
ncbi:MAG TPA: hypothetical protein VK578_02760 [Edaphobacter sp.]|nr:hypothetical protein [Edaphobacter sp.]